MPAYCPGCGAFHEPEYDHVGLPGSHLWHITCLLTLRRDLEFYPSRRNVRTAVARPPSTTVYYWTPNALVDERPPDGRWRRNRNGVVGYWSDDLTFVPRCCYSCAYFRPGMLYNEASTYRFPPVCDLNVKLPTVKGNCRRRWGAPIGPLLPDHGGPHVINGIPVNPDDSVPEGMVRATFKDGSTRLFTLEQARRLASGKYKLHARAQLTAPEFAKLRRVERRSPTDDQLRRQRRKQERRNRAAARRR